MNYSNSQRAGVILNFTALLFGAYALTVNKQMINDDKQDIIDVHFLLYIIYNLPYKIMPGGVMYDHR